MEVKEMMPRYPDEDVVKSNITGFFVFSLCSSTVDSVLQQLTSANSHRLGSLGMDAIHLPTRLLNPR